MQKVHNTRNKDKINLIQKNLPLAILIHSLIGIKQNKHIDFSDYHPLRRQ